MTDQTLSRISVFKRALPIIGANIATPLVGLVDIAVIGNTGTTEAIAAVALGALMFSILYYAFGFLRMGVTALAAQAEGAKQAGEIAAVLWRGCLTGGAIGLVILALTPVLAPGLLHLFSGTENTEALAQSYFNARLWGAPANLAGIAIYGWLIGLGFTGRALILQMALNLSNIALSLGLVLGLDLGVFGLGLASALSQWVQLLVASIIILAILKARQSPSLRQIANISVILRMMAVNRDIFLRTLALISGFYWFNEASLQLGPEVLAGNAILLQFITISAYFLDAFAHVTEGEVGRAAGAKNWPELVRAFKVTSELAFTFSIILTCMIALGGQVFIGLMTDEALVRESAIRGLYWCALVPLLGWPSYQLDGLMIGTTQGPLMRNAMIAALIIYVALDIVLRPAFGYHGLWVAFLCYYLARAGTLAIGWTGLRRSLSEP
jgi:MATE family multidrug resistance protein